jgi:hypothetical protein
MKEEEKMGAGKIERELNKNKDIWKPPVTNRNKEGGWRKSYINKLLNNNLQLIGEFQPCRIEYKIEKDNEGNVKKHRIRVPDGPSIKGYFPNIFKEEEDLFYKVQEKIKINRKLKGNSGGRTGKAWNLFTHIIKCGFCNSPMHYVDKGSSSKGGQYLHCDSSQRKLWDKDEQKCNAKSIRYNDFERLFFKSIWELNFDKILPHDNEIQTHIMELKDKLDVIEYKKNQINSQKVKYTKAIGFAKTDYNIIEFLEILKALKKEDEEILKERIKFKKQIEELEDNRKRFNQNRSHYKEVYDLLESAANEEQRIKIRLQLRHQIRKLIAKIVIIPYHADKEKVYNETKQKYEELLKLLKEKSQNNYTYGKVVLNSYRNTLRNIEEDDSNDVIYGGTAVIHFNMFDSKRVLLSLMNDKLPEYLF